MNIPTDFQQLFEYLRKKKEEYDTTEVKIGVIGESGTGKSSLINRIFGDYVAEVGATEQTNEPIAYKKDHVFFVDLPGAGTQKWPIETYLNDLKLLKGYDAFLLVNRGRVMENEVRIYKELCAAGKRVFVVRNQFDNALEGEMSKPASKRLLEEELRTRIEADLQEKLQDPYAKVYLTSAHQKHPIFDLDALLEDIEGSLGELKRLRFINEAAILSERALEEKQKAASNIVMMHAALAAANGLNPIPGLDVSVDATILVSMSTQIVRSYGLTKDQLEWVSATGQANFVALAQRLGTRFAQYLVKEAILKMLARFAAQETLKTVAKWVPFVGSLVAAGLGYQITVSFGDSLIAECHQAATEVLAANKKTLAP